MPPPLPAGCSGVAAGLVVSLVPRRDASPSISGLAASSLSRSPAPSLARSEAGPDDSPFTHDASFFADNVAKTQSTASAEDLADFARWYHMSGPVSGAPPFPVGGRGAVPAPMAAYATRQSPSVSSCASSDDSDNPRRRRGGVGSSPVLGGSRAQRVKEHASTDVGGQPKVRGRRMGILPSCRTLGADRGRQLGARAQGG